MRPDRSADVPVVCTLDAGSYADREDAWSSVFARAASHRRTQGGVRVTFDPGVDLSALLDLVGAEQRCCAFLSFHLDLTPAGSVLEVRTPPGAEAALPTVFEPQPGVGSPP